MYILYNTQNDITSVLRKFLKENTTCLYKTQLNFLPEVIFGMSVSESIVSHKISAELKEQLKFAQLESIKRRVSRLMNNTRFQGKVCFFEVVKHIIDNLKPKHNDNRLHVIIDHSYSKDNYTVLMCSMRVGKQGIPIYFEVFDGINNPEAFYDSTLIKAVNYINNLFKDKNVNLIFLADRWFNSYELLKTIKNLGRTYVIRSKGNLNIKVFTPKEAHKIRMQTGDLKGFSNSAKFYYDVELYEEHEFTTNITISKRKNKDKDIDEPWIILTNGDPKRAIKDYGYRFGGIETIFKNQKSNGFYLEKIVNASMTYYENSFATLCITICLMTCIGVDYSKNKSCYKNVKIQTHKNINGKRTRVMSIFRTGLTLFKLAFNSYIYIRLPLTFTLYDM